MNAVVKYYRNVKEELDKVAFPTKDLIRNAFISVLVVVSVITLFVSLSDLILHYIISSFIS